MKGHELLVDVEAVVDYPDTFPPGDPNIWEMVMSLARVPISGDSKSHFLAVVSQ